MSGVRYTAAMPVKKTLLQRVEQRTGMSAHDIAALSRFLVAGGTSVLVKIGVYALLSRVVWVSGSRTIENGIAIVLSTVYNYLVHRFWTFAHQQPESGSASRYVVVWVSASALETFLFWLLHVQFGLYDLAVLVFNAGFISMLTFVVHRVFTFRGHSRVSGGR